MEKLTAWCKTELHVDRLVRDVPVEKRLKEGESGWRTELFHECKGKNDDGTNNDDQIVSIQEPFSEIRPHKQMRKSEYNQAKKKKRQQNTESAMREPRRNPE